MKGLFTFVVIVFSLNFLISQENRLALQYFRNGEYEKAAMLYQKLYDDSEQNEYYFERYLEALFALEDFDTAEKTIKKQLRKQPENSKIRVLYGQLYERQFDDIKANTQFRLAIDQLVADRGMIVNLANAFTTMTKVDYAIETLLKGGKLLKDDYLFAYNLGDLYRRKGDSPNMIRYFLKSMENNPNRLANIQTVLQQFLYPPDYQELQSQLLLYIQQKPDQIHFNELLIWAFVQQKNYRSALRQAQALDRRLRESGFRVYQLAEIAGNDEDFDAAIQGFDYIIQEKGATSPFYLEAKKQSLWVRQTKLLKGLDYTTQDLEILSALYEEFIKEFGKSPVTAGLILEYAKFKAFYRNDLKSAIADLVLLLEFPNLSKEIAANVKLNLGDFYLMDGEVWESTLLYSQVDKEFKEDALGHEARYRNARLSYFKGDFQWAQAQFNILKASTSKLIANDALDLSVFIMDNLGLDTNGLAMQKFADAEMMLFRNEFEKSVDLLNQLLIDFPGHQLEDDVLYLKATIFKKKKEFDKAIELFDRILLEFPTEIKADNSIFELAEIYETIKQDENKAMELYEKLFVEYPGSIFAIDARKKFRELRGDLF
jgi:tetratricopeptide (TPR) repeat protein